MPHLHTHAWFAIYPSLREMPHKKSEKIRLHRGSHFCFLSIAPTRINFWLWLFSFISLAFGTFCAECCCWQYCSFSLLNQGRAVLKCRICGQTGACNGPLKEARKTKICTKMIYCCIITAILHWPLELGDETDMMMIWVFLPFLNLLLIFRIYVLIASPWLAQRDLLAVLLFNWVIEVKA